MAMPVDPLRSELISELSELVTSVALKTTNFERELKQLKVTLGRIESIFIEIKKLNGKLDRTPLESAMFKDEIKDARELVYKCLKIKWNPSKKDSHSRKLKEVNDKLVRFFQIELQADQSRDIKLMPVEGNGAIQNFMSMPWRREHVGWPVPTLPTGIEGFDGQIEDLKGKVLTDNDYDGSSMNGDNRFDDGSVVVVSAARGCGKTTLVTKLCHDPDIKAIFREKIFFVTVSKNPDFMVIVNDFLTNSFGQQVLFHSSEDAKNALKKFLCEKVSGPILLVLDDVKSGSFIKSFAFKIRGYKILVTSTMVLPEYGVFQFGGLSDEDAKKLFQHSAFPENKRPRPTISEHLVNQMVKCCKKHPLTLSMVGSSLDGKDETVWRYMLKMLSQSRSVLDLNEEILDRLERSFEALDEKFKQCYLDFELFPEDQRIPAGALLNRRVHMYDHDDEGNDTLAKIFELSYRNLHEGLYNITEAAAICKGTILHTSGMQ